MQFAFLSSLKTGARSAVPLFIFSLFYFCLSANAAFDEGLRTPDRQDPGSVPESWTSGSARQAFEQGLISKEAGRLDESERYFKKAVEEEPSNADYHFELANVFALQRDSALHDRDALRAQESLASAARALEQTVMIRPDFLAAHFNLGVVYKKQQKYEEARQEFKKGMELVPPGQPVTPFLMQIASIYEDQGFYDDAESLYNEAMEKDYGNTEIRNALETLGERRQASILRERQTQGSRLQNLAAAGSRYGSNSGLLQNGQQQAPGLGQFVPALGSWLVQQMMNRKGSAETRQ